MADAQGTSKEAAQGQQSRPNLQVQSVRSIATLGTMSAVHNKKKKWYDAMFWQLTYAEWFLVSSAIISTWIVIAFFFWGQLEVSETIRGTDYLVIPDVWYLNTRFNYEYTFTYIPGTPVYSLGQRNMIFNKPMCQNVAGQTPPGTLTPEGLEADLGKEDPTCSQYPIYPWQKRYFEQPGPKTRFGDQQLACGNPNVRYVNGYTPYNYQEAALNGDVNALRNTCLFGLYYTLFQR